MDFCFHRGRLRQSLIVGDLKEEEEEEEVVEEVGEDYDDDDDGLMQSRKFEMKDEAESEKEDEDRLRQSRRFGDKEKQKEDDGDGDGDGDDDDDDEGEEPATIIPGLPNELSMLCLARIPSGQRPLARRVSRSWLDALKPSRMDETRRRCGISETKVFTCLTHIEHQKRFSTWFILDPSMSSCKCIPPPPIRKHVSDGDGDDDGDGEGIDVFSSFVELEGKQVLVAGSRECSCLFRLDAYSRKWKPLPFSLTMRSSGCASGWLGGYLYMAGGFDENLEPLKSAKRLKVENGEVEDIKDMNSVRGSSTGVVLNGLFCVIGGCHKEGVDELEVHNSAEVWDPLSKEWTVVHEMWPREIFREMESPMVAVVSDQLYALRPHKWELMWYNMDSKIWKSLSRLPVELCNPHFPYVFGAPQITGLISVGKELWVTVHCASDIFVLASKPSMDCHFTWRRLAFTFSDFTSISASIAVTM